MMTRIACSSPLVATDATLKATYTHDCEVKAVLGVVPILSFEVFRAILPLLALSTQLQEEDDKGEGLYEFVGPRVSPPTFRIGY